MAPQIPRLALTFGVLVVGFFVFRSQTVPASFGEKGFYRAAFVEELEKRPFVHAGKDACVACHDDKPDVTSHFKAGVACESCHGPAYAHTEDFEQFKPKATLTRADCGRCHAKNAARPEFVPQVDFKEHNPEEPCVTCHVIHM